MQKFTLTTYVVVKSHNSATYGDKSLMTLGPKMWNALPEKIKSEHHIKNLRNTLIYGYGLDPNADARCTYTNLFMERAHRGNYKNPNSPIYAKFLSWKVAQGILESIIKANR